MRIDILTLFPDLCEAVMGESIIGRARAKGAIEVYCHYIRTYAGNTRGQVDGYPYGGGMGMILAPGPIFDCFADVCKQAGSRPHLIYLSPGGRTFTQPRAVELAALGHIALLCGHYEGVDERVLDEIVDEEISLGDFVLTGGELPALAVADAVARLVPGVLSDASCFTEESHFSGLLEYPQYTRPPVWRERAIPDVLTSGHHANIARWRREQSLARTASRRPDMLQNAQLGAEDRASLAAITADEKQDTKG